MHVQQTTLDNGLTVITNTSPYLESAMVGAFVNVGARNETPEINGISHFSEHMAFKATTRRNAQDIASEIEILGSDINAWTSMDMTTYHVTGLAKHVGQAIDIIGDVMSDSLFLPEDIAIESGVIMQEVSRSEDSPNNVAYNALQAVSYPDQPLGRTVLGSPEFIRNATHDDFNTYYRQHYTADNMVVVGAGGIAHDDLVKMTEKAFATLPMTAAAPTSRVPEPAHYVGGTVIDRSRDFKQVTAAIAFPTVSLLDAKYYHHRLLADAFGGGMSAPLFIEIREKRGLVYSTGCYVNQGVDHGRLVISGGMTSENVEEFVSVACAEFRKLCDNINPTDLERAKNGSLVALATLLEKPYSTACYMAGSYWQRGRVRSLDEMREQIEAVTLDDLRAAAAHVLSGTPSIALVGPVPEADYDDLVRAAIS